MNSSGEPDHDDIARAWPHWQSWKGINGMCYARRATPGAALSAGPAEDWLDLADQIRRAEAKLEDIPQAWRDA